MATSDILNSTEVLFQNLPPEIVSSMGILLNIFKAVGIIFIIYLLFLIIGSLLNIRRTIKIDQIHKRVIELDEKMDILLKDHKLITQKVLKEKSELREKHKKGLLRRFLEFLKIKKNNSSENKSTDKEAATKSKANKIKNKKTKKD